MKRFFSRVSALLTLVALLLPAMVGCSTPPPELDSVRDELIALLEASYAVNDILFGTGLVTEYELSGLKTDYSEEVKNAEGWYTDEQVFYNYYSPVVSSYMKDTDGDGIGDTKVEQPTSVEAIKAMCREVYSQSFLEKYFHQVFVGQTDVAVGQTQILKPRYRESYVNDDVSFENESSTGSAVSSTAPLRKYIFIDQTNMNFIDPRGRTVYDYDTMRVVSPSDGDTLLIELAAYYQHESYEGSESLDKWETEYEYAWERVVVTFVKENGEWRLDSATY